MKRGKPKQLACVRIGYAEYLMPVTDAAKVVELMSGAVETRNHYGKDGDEYSIGKPPELGYRLVRPSQVRRPHDVDDDPMTLPLRITERSGVQGLLPAPAESLWSKVKP